MPHIRSSVFFRPLLRAEGLIGRFWPICFGKCKLFICEEILEKYGKVTTPQSNGLFWGLKHFENGWNFSHTFLTYTKFKFCKKKRSKTTTQTWDLSKKFTLPDFWDKNFTPLISPNFKSFGDKTQKQICENGEIYTADKKLYTPDGSVGSDKSQHLLKENNAAYRGSPPWTQSQHHSNKETGTAMY